MFYTYVLKSTVDGNFYTGFTNDLKRRVIEHNKGLVASTEKRIPFELVYYEACRCEKDAIVREKYLKTTYEHRYLKNRLKND
jgi:putative endonuclease